MEETIRFDEWFEEWDERIRWLDKTSRRLIEIEKEYHEKSKIILQKAIEHNVDFKGIYGGNTERTRRQYVDEQLSELLDEKQELELLKADDNRRISFLNKIIALNMELLRYQ